MRLPRITPAVRKELRLFAWAVTTFGSGYFTVHAGIAALQKDYRLALLTMAIVLLYLVISHAAHTKPE